MGYYPDVHCEEAFDFVVETRLKHVEMDVFRVWKFKTRV